MPAANVTSPRNSGWRAAAFLALWPLLLSAQPSGRPNGSNDHASISVKLGAGSESPRPVMRLEWSAAPVAVPKISVSTPRTAGTWLRVWPGNDDAPPWWFVPIGMGTSPDLRAGAWSASGAVHVQVDWTGSGKFRRFLPVIFTFTEG